MQFKEFLMQEKKIVLTSYGNGDSIDKISISLYDDNYESEDNASNYCTTINNLELKDNSWIYAKIVSANTPYNMQEFIPYNLKDLILKLDNLALQKVIREIDSKVLAQALVYEKEDIRDKIFKNVSKNACKMLIDDIKFFTPSLKADIKQAQDKIMNVILELLRYGEIISPYDKEAVDNYL